MTALSIQQPWAYAILFLGKPVENRTWPTKVRGRIQIHAGKKLDKEGVAWIRLRGHDVPNDLPMGGFVGEVTLTDCVEDCDVSEDAEPWAFGPWCFVLAEPAPYAEMIPARGQLGFFQSENAGSYVE